MRSHTVPQSPRGLRQLRTLAYRTQLRTLCAYARAADLCVADTHGTVLCLNGSLGAGEAQTNRQTDTHTDRQAAAALNVPFRLPYWSNTASTSWPISLRLKEASVTRSIFLTVRC